MKLYRAIIENNISPNKDGRVQVRIFGIHNNDKQAVQTKHLPWAEVMQSTAFGFSSGVGFSSIPNIGTWVFVTLDHDNPNMPIIIGAISGNSTESNEYQFPLDDRLNEEDQNRLQRVDKLDQTIHQKINDTVDIVNKTDGESGANVTQTEPNSLSDLTVYPDNAIIETKSGHVIEIDDTPTNEKIRMYHTSGTYIDYRPDGSKIEKTKMNINSITEGYIHEHIMKSVKTYINENMDEIIDGYVKRNIGSTLDEHIVGNVKQTMDGNQTIKIAGNLDIDVGGTINIKSGGSQTNTNGGNYSHTAPKIDLN